jgi:hypothetical protein
MPGLTSFRHGQRDGRNKGGRHAAEALPGAQLKIVEGMVHDLPHVEAWARIAHAKNSMRSTSFGNRYMPTACQKDRLGAVINRFAG